MGAAAGAGGGAAGPPAQALLEKHCAFFISRSIIVMNDHFDVMIVRYLFFFRISINTFCSGLIVKVFKSFMCSQISCFLSLDGPLPSLSKKNYTKHFSFQFFGYFSNNIKNQQLKTSTY